MYLDYFGLSDHPFRITPDTRLFFEGGDRGDILQALLYTVQSGQGVIKVVGEVGMGKTMLCRMLEQNLSDNIKIVYIANPSLTPDNILNVIAQELGLLSKPSDKLRALQVLQERLLEHHAKGDRVVVLIEEAQRMPLETLEEIRLLSNLETQTDKLLQIVLFGQPELDSNLSKYEIRPLTERITQQFYLNALEEKDLQSYLNFRMRSVGFAGADFFTAPIVKRIAFASQGLLRRVNLIADKALLACYADGKNVLKMSHVIAAVHESNFNDDNLIQRSRSTSWVKVAIGTGLVTLILGMVAVFINHQPKFDVQVATNSDDANPNAAVNPPLLTQVATNTVADEQAQSESNTSDDSGVSLNTVMDSQTVNTVESVTSTAQVETKIVLPDKGNDLTGFSAETDVEATFDLASFLKNGDNWSNTSSDQNASIQLIVLPEKAVKTTARFIEQLAKSGLPARDIWVKKTRIKQEPANVFMVGYFDNEAHANQAINTLPKLLKKLQPLARSMRAFRKYAP